jgi:CheY-like chemotaxis protein
MLAVSPTLLVSDDDLAFRQTLCTVFEGRGIRTYSAGDGEEALQIICTQEVHLVLVDMHMPRLTGLETIRRAKQLKALMPCILMSAHLDDLLIEQARELHAFSVLSKPVTFRQLLGAVGQALESTYNWHSGDWRVA